MNIMRKKQKTIFGLILGLLITLISGSVLAGGWAEITMDELPEEVHAGESMQLSFMVFQHGKTPVHFLGSGEAAVAIVPVITGSNVKTGETVEFTAVPDKSEVGRFSAEVTFPAEGEWRWEIEPTPLVGVTELAPLTILPAVKAVIVETGTTFETGAASTSTAEAAGLSAIVPWASVLLLVVGFGLIGFLYARRNRQLPIAVDSGD